MDGHRESRKRLRPWLERMIGNMDCPGLVWENKEERTFRIPWRHFNNKDWVERDSQIFMEWAKYTGKYDGEKLEYPVWKTRLRCALKKIPEIKELPDLHHLEDPDPYRVYQFVDVPVMKKVSDFDSDYSASPGSSTSFFTNSPAVRDFLEDSMTPPPQKYFDETFLNPKHQSSVPTVVYEEDSFNYNNLAVKMEEGTYPHKFANTAREAVNCHPTLGDQHYGSEFPCFGNFNISPEQAFLQQMPSQSQNYSDMSNIISSAQPVFPMLVHETAEGLVDLQAGTDNMKTSLPSDLNSVETSDLYCSMALSGITSLSLPGSHGAENVSNVMHLILRYGFPHIDVLQKKVAANGCRLYFGAQQLQNTTMEEELYGPKNVTQIEMPNVNQFPDICEEQKRFICELHNCMERGLVLTYENGDIYAKRLCRTRVFVSDGVAESRLLDRKEKNPTKVFDFAAFKASFEKYRTTKNSALPKYFFFLTFGQEVKMNRSEPMGRVLIHVQVLHSEAAEYVSKYSSSEASHSFALISSCDPHDKLLQGFTNMSINK